MSNGDGPIDLHFILDVSSQLGPTYLEPLQIPRCEDQNARKMMEACHVTQPKRRQCEASALHQGQLLLALDDNSAYPDHFSAVTLRLVLAVPQWRAPECLATAMRLLAQTAAWLKLWRGRVRSRVALFMKRLRCWEKATQTTSAHQTH